MLLCLEALASHLPSVTAMLPLFSCAQVRFGNTKTCPDGGHALACGCFECAGRTQRPRFHLGAALVHVFCRTPRQANPFAVLRLCLALANRCCIWVCEAHWYYGGHALACGCFGCARRTQRPRFHLGASLVHGICRTAKHPNGLIVLRLCVRAGIAALFGRRHRSSTHIGVGRPRHI